MIKKSTAAHTHWVNYFKTRILGFLSQVKPPEVRNLKAVEIRKRQVTIQWIPPLYHLHYDVRSYIVDVRGFGDSFKERHTVRTPVNSFEFTGLDAGTSYTIKAFGINHVGEGIPRELEIETLSGRNGSNHGS